MNAGGSSRRSTGALPVAVITLLAWSGLLADEFDPTQVDEGQLEATLAESGWVLLTKRGVLPTEFTLEEQDTIVVAASNSNALIYREIPAAESVDSGAKPVLSWEWRVDRSEQGVGNGPDPDWPIAVYAAFEVDKQYMGWWRRMLNSLVAGVSGLPESGKILTYVWSLDEAKGLSYPNPYLPKTANLEVLQAGEVGESYWRMERRDLMADFKAAFGHPAERILFIAISADSEDRNSSSMARIRSLRLD